MNSSECRGYWEIEEKSFKNKNFFLKHKKNTWIHPMFLPIFLNVCIVVVVAVVVFLVIFL